MQTPVVQQDEGKIADVPLTALQLSHQQYSSNHSHSGRQQNNHCHAVRIRIDERVNSESIRKHCNHIIDVLTPLASSVPEQSCLGGLWFESIHDDADSELAEVRRQAEIARPVSALHGMLFRALVLQFQDSKADLIVVADRVFLDRESLFNIASALTTGDTASLALLASGSSTAATLEKSPQLNELECGNYSPTPVWGKVSAKNIDAAEGEGIGKYFYSLDNEAVPKSPAEMLAAVGFVLSRFNNEESPVVGALVDSNLKKECSNHLGVQQGLSLFPISIDESSTFVELVNQIKKNLTKPLWYDRELRLHLQEKCENAGEVSVGVVFDNNTFDDLAIADYRAYLDTVFPLTLIYQKSAAGIYCLFDEEVFDNDMLGRFMDAYCYVQTQVNQREQTSENLLLSQIGTIDPRKEKYIAAIGRTQEKGSAETIKPKRIDTLFSEQAAAYPSQIAVSLGDESITYEKLDEKSNQIARVLVDEGVKPNAIVGICLERSVDLIVMMLSVLKAGAVYVPMDPDYPDERLSYTASNAGIEKVIVADKPFPEDEAWELFSTQILKEQSEAKSTAALELALSVDDPAYVIYTSGSTGKPKGVVIPHCNVFHLLNSTKEDFKLSNNDRWTLLHSSAFDFSVWEIWGCLLTGGHLIVVPYWVARSPSEFYDLIYEEKITVLNQTPSYFASLIDIDQRQQKSLTLRLVIFGGEPLQTRMLLPWFYSHSETQCRLVNMFGITETTVHVTAQHLNHRHALQGSQSVGPAMPGWHLYVLDAQGHLLPPGVPGEIYVAGHGVALRYLNKPELTEQRFVIDPFVDEPTGDQRMYRSGDKGRLLSDGRLEHMGRLDNQIKLRGYRIELGEIREVLLQVPTVKQAAVVLHRENEQDNASVRIDAYVVSEERNIGIIKQAIARLLPEYMMPSTITLLASLPMTINGKLDAKKLPIPEALSLEKNAEADAGNIDSLSNSIVEKKTGTKDASTNGSFEQSMQEVWQSILNVPVGLDDNFFDLGGNSLLAIRLSTAMEEQGMPAISLKDLYIYQNIRSLVKSMQSEVA